MTNLTPASLRARQILLELRTAHAVRLADTPEAPASRQVRRADERRFLKSLSSHPHSAAAARTRFEGRK